MVNNEVVAVDLTEENLDKLPQDLDAVYIALHGGWGGREVSLGTHLRSAWRAPAPEEQGRYVFAAGGGATRYGAWKALDKRRKARH